MMRAILTWLDDRTGLPSAVQHFFDEEIPASSGWHQVPGSVALFAFLVQAVTGILLSLNFAPVAGESYNSLRYIILEVTGGRLMRQLHHWGASVMIVVVVLHMVQVLIWGAYKKPREATWIVGVVLLLLTLAYGLTGYLLPWDNRAYWGTVVTTQIAGSAPLAGAYMQQLMGVQDGAIGALTFARFYSVHVLILPPATMALILLHVYLVRRHGVAPQPGDESRPRKKFYPAQVFKDTVAIFAVFMILFLLANFLRVPLERMADPTDTSYIPRPEWYFLFLFQTLKFFEGPLELVGTMVLPGLAIGALFLLPFLDRGAIRRVADRKLAMAAVAFAGLGWGALTYAAIASTPKNMQSDFDATLVEKWQYMTPKELAAGPPEAPSWAVEAGKLYGRLGCAACHIVSGEGGRLGPELNAVMFRRDRAWLEGHFREPQRFSPGTSMPPYKLPQPQMDLIVRYMLSLPPL